MALLQVQSLIVAGGAGVLSFLLGHHDRSELGSPPAVSTGPTATAPTTALTARSPAHTTHPTVDRTLRLRDGYFECALVVAVAMLSAATSSAVQGSFVCALIVWARRWGLDPDNTVVPLAGSLGDITTLVLLGLLGAGLVQFEGTGLATFLFVVLILLCCAFTVVTLRNAYVYELLAFGWTSLFIAAVVSSTAGVVLERSAAMFEGFALISPVFSGIPGVCSAVLVSRLSTGLHSGAMQAPSRPMGDGEYIRLRAADVPPPEEARVAAAGALPPATSRLAAVRRLAHQLFVSMCPPLSLGGYKVPMTLFGNGLVVLLCFLLLLRLTGTLVFGFGFALTFTVMAAVLTAGSLISAHQLTLFLWYWDYDPGRSPLGCASLTTRHLQYALYIFPN